MAAIVSGGIYSILLVWQFLPLIPSGMDRSDPVGQAEKKEYFYIIPEF